MSRPFEELVDEVHAMISRMDEVTSVEPPPDDPRTAVERMAEALDEEPDRVADAVVAFTMIGRAVGPAPDSCGLTTCGTVAEVVVTVRSILDDNRDQIFSVGTCKEHLSEGMKVVEQLFTDNPPMHMNPKGWG